MRVKMLIMRFYLNLRDKKDLVFLVKSKERSKSKRLSQQAHLRVMKSLLTYLMETQMRRMQTQRNT
jgi:hypothetical protein